jgi:hypothetical protein
MTGVDIAAEETIVIMETAGTVLARPRRSA